MFKMTPHRASKTGRPLATPLQSAPGQLYRALFRFNPCPMWIFDQGTLRFLDINEAALKLYGWSRAEFLGMTLKDVHPPKEVQSLRARLVIQRRGWAAYVGEWRHWRKDHTLLDVEVTSNPIRFQGRAARLSILKDITERNRAEQSLRESEARYRNLFDNDLTGDFIAEPDGTIVLCNLAFADIFGFAGIKAVVGSNFTALCSPEDSWPAFVKLLRRRKRLDRHVRIARHCDGRPLHILETVVGTFNRQGDLGQIQGYVFDNTERTLAVSALRASEERLALAASGTRIGMFEWNIATGKRVWNEQFARLLGLRTTKATSTTLSLAGHYRDWARRVHPEDLPQVEAELRRCMAEHAPYEAEYRLLWPDKSVHWVVGRGAFYYDAKGRPMRMLGIIMDISIRKRAEEELKKLATTLEQRVAERTVDLTNAYDRLRAITDSALVGILTLNARRRIEAVNPAVMTIFGYPLSEMIGRKISKLIASPRQVQGENFLASHTRSGNQRFVGFWREVLGRRKDGHAIMLELSVTEFTHSGRRQFVAMVRDITRRKRLERELLEAGERERQRLGHDLHDGLGQHLHALYYMAGLLEKETKEISPKQAREAGRLVRELEHALELSRGLARGLQPVSPIPEGLMTALHELAKRTRELYRVACRFECRAPVLIHRHSAANHLYRIAQEAVNNAMKHGKPTLIRIKLMASPQRIVLGIHDNGMGIRRQPGRAHGMGLHIMQYRADALSGSLLVQRHPKGGTEVVCTVTRQVQLPQEESLK